MNFYGGHNITRKLLCSFMDFFADTKIAKYGLDANGNVVQNKLYQVPIMWGSASKWLQIARNMTARKPGIDSVEISNRPIEIDRMLPRIGVTMTNMAYDPSRHLGKTQKVRDYNKYSNTQEDNVYAPVPYNIDVDLSVIAKNLNEVFQIVEQILPYFTPSLSLDIKIIDDRPAESVPIILTSLSPDIIDEISELEDRTFSFIMSFTIKGNYYLPKQTDKNVNLVDIDTIGVSLADDNFTKYLNNYKVTKP